MCWVLVHGRVPASAYLFMPTSVSVSICISEYLYLPLPGSVYLSLPISAKHDLHICLPSSTRQIVCHVIHHHYRAPLSRFLEGALYKYPEWMNESSSSTNPECDREANNSQSPYGTSTFYCWIILVASIFVPMFLLIKLGRLCSWERGVEVYDGNEKIMAMVFGG